MRRHAVVGHVLGGRLTRPPRSLVWSGTIDEWGRHRLPMKHTTPVDRAERRPGRRRQPQAGFEWKSSHRRWRQPAGEQGRRERRYSGRLGAGQPEEDHDGTTQPDHVLIGETPDRFSQLGARHGGDLVHHEAAGHPEAVLIVGGHGEPNQWRLGRIGGEGAYGHRVCRIKAVVLNDDHRARLARVSATC